MTKKKYYDEHGNQIRSRSSAHRKKKKWMGMTIVFCVILGAIGIFVFGNDEEIANDSIDKEEPNKKEENATGDEGTSDVEEENVEDQAYTYEDFEGTYVVFSEEPYESPIMGMSDIIVLGEDYYQSFNRWDFDMTSTIHDTTIEGNMLKLDVDSDENEVWGLHSESGLEEFELRYDGDNKVLYSRTYDQEYYSMSIQDLQTHYTQKEIDYARILMTVYGEPSLDQWAVWEENFGTIVVGVSYHSAGEATEVSEEVPYPEDVTHLNLSKQGMAAGVVTYSSHGDGHITRYPMPLHYHQEDQSKEGYRKLAEESLDNAEVIYVEPFEPYIVADFIGHVDFEYE